MVILSEGPYRDLGSGFARLTGVEGVRRAPSHIETVEDALLELVRNSTDAGAKNVYVASILHARRYRELVVLDDGCGVPDAYRSMIFDAGVTTRHLSPSRLVDRTHGAGLSLHHIKEAALSAELRSTNGPTSIRAVFDTRNLPERSLQSGRDPNRSSRTNLKATLQAVKETPEAPEIFYGSPASILSRLLHNRIISEDAKIDELAAWCEEKVGANVSRRTLQRIRKGLVAPAERVSERARGGMRSAEDGDSGEVGKRGFSAAGIKLELDERDLAQIRAVMERAARESYLEVGDIGFEAREGEITIRAGIYEAEDDYDE